MKCVVCNTDATMLFKGCCATCSKGADCHFCGMTKESKYARKGHERVCHSNPANMVVARPRAVYVPEGTPAFANAFMAYNARFGRGDHPNAIQRAAHRFVEPYAKVSRALTSFNPV